MVQTIPARSAALVTRFPNPGSTKEPEPGTFGAKLRRLREGAGYTQSALAAKLGWRQNLLSNYELNLSTPASPERQAALDAALGVPPGTIAGMLPRRVSRQPRRGDDGVRSALERLSDEERRLLMELIDRMADDPAEGTG